MMVDYIVIYVQALKTVYAEFKKGDVTDSDVNRGKALLKANLLSSTESSYVADYIVKQVALDAVTTPEQVASAVDSVTAADVKQVCRVTYPKLSTVEILRNY